MIKKLVIGITVLAVSAVMFGVAFADSNHHNNTATGGTGIGVGIGGQGGEGGQGGNATAVQSQTSINSNTNVNVNSQGQQQGQVQGQDQGQKQSADNKGNKQSIKVESQMIPGVAVAPGLTSGGTQVCLGSFSVGLSGPMAGVAFGKTVVDKGCEDRQNAILLFNMGFGYEALHLLMGSNERVKALFTPPIAPVSKVEPMPTQVGDAKPPVTAEPRVLTPYAVTPESVQSN